MKLGDLKEWGHGKSRTRMERALSMAAQRYIDSRKREREQSGLLPVILVGSALFSIATAGFVVFLLVQKLAH